MLSEGFSSLYQSVQWLGTVCEVAITVKVFNLQNLPMNSLLSALQLTHLGAGHGAKHRFSWEGPATTHPTIFKHPRAVLSLGTELPRTERGHSHLDPWSYPAGHILHHPFWDIWAELWPGPAAMLVCKVVFEMWMMKQAQRYLHFGFWVMIFSPSGRRAVKLYHLPFFLSIFCCPAALRTDARYPYRLEGLLVWRSSIVLLEGLEDKIPCRESQLILMMISL